MNKPCQHESIEAGCSACDLFHKREDYRLLWSGASIEDVVAASQRIAEKDGGLPFFRLPNVPVEQIKALDTSKGKCIHLGVTVPNTSGGCRTTHECEFEEWDSTTQTSVRKHGNVRPCVECKQCPDFTSEEQP